MKREVKAFGWSCAESGQQTSGNCVHRYECQHTRRGLKSKYKPINTLGRCGGVFLGLVSIQTISNLFGRSLDRGEV